MVEEWSVDVKVKSLFMVLFVLVSLPLIFACDSDHDCGTSTPSINANAIHGGEMMSSFYGMNFLIVLIQILIVTSLILFIIWMIKNLNGGKNRKNG